MANYRATRAIATSYGRVPKGAVVELSSKEAKHLGSFVEKTDAEVTDARFIGANNFDPNANKTLSGDAPQNTSNDDESNDDESNDDDSDDESSLDDLSVDELKARAKELDLPVSGTKAQLIERITLAEQAGDDDSDDSSDDE